MKWTPPVPRATGIQSEHTHTARLPAVLTVISCASISLVNRNAAPRVRAVSQTWAADAKGCPKSRSGTSNFPSSTPMSTLHKQSLHAVCRSSANAFWSKVFFSACPDNSAREFLQKKCNICDKRHKDAGIDVSLRAHTVCDSRCCGLSKRALI